MFRQTRRRLISDIQYVMDLQGLLAEWTSPRRSGIS